MSAFSRKLRKTANGIAHWCPGCKEVHVFPLPRWTWDGNVDAPTTTPSMRIFLPARGDNPEKTLCHYYLKSGKIEFCGDCAHPLSGKTVDLSDWPYPAGTYGGVEC
jgi:Family of unknown function (DUF6527)